MNIRPVQLEGHENLITCVSYLSKMKKVVSGSDDCYLRVWNLQEMECVQVLKNHSKGVVKILDLPKKNLFLTGEKINALKFIAIPTLGLFSA